jgi:hypothetical protein
MRWHYHLGHLTFDKLKQLALNGKIPKKLAHIKPPTCAGCLIGAMTKIPWCVKESKSSHEVFVETKPGETVSVNQMVSTEVGIFAQLKGKLTKKRYRCCTNFVDHYSRLRFMHNQIDDSSVKTVAAKHTFEKFAAKHGACIHHYHCNNDPFADNAFKEEPAFDLNFNYRSVVGKLNYLAQTTRPDDMYATNQIAKYSSDPRTSHGEAVLYLICYLKKTRELGLHFKPDRNKGFECYCDADFSGL